MQHQFDVRVYYEDTDAGGVVYYSNYLNYAERARTELLRGLGIHQSELAEKENIFFVVHEVNAKFKKPAKLDDLLTINTKITEISAASIKMQQSICKGTKHPEELVSLLIYIVCVNRQFKPARIPAHIRTILDQKFV